MRVPGILRSLVLALGLVLLLGCGAGDAGPDAPPAALPQTTDDTAAPRPAVEDRSVPTMVLIASTSSPATSPADAPDAAAGRETPRPTAARATPEQTRALPTETRVPTNTMSPASANPPAPTGPPSPDPSESRPLVMVGETPFVVEVVETPESRAQGLSGRESLADGTGMLFVFKKEGVRSFWMKEMNFPLDMVWIDAACTVVHISEDVPPPAPDQPLSGLPTYGPSEPILYVLEIKGGVSGTAGLAPGDSVSFAGSLAGKYGC